MKSPARGKLLAALLFLAAGIGVAVPPAWSADEGISIELNRLKPVKDACRISLVFTNALPVPVDLLAIETVLFNTDATVERFLVLKSRPLAPKKIRVQQFDVRGVPCERFGKLLLNDVKACKAGELDGPACLDRLQPSSRAENVPFVSTVTN